MSFPVPLQTEQNRAQLMGMSAQSRARAGSCRRRTRASASLEVGDASGAARQLVTSLGAMPACWNLVKPFRRFMRFSVRCSCQRSSLLSRRRS